MPIPHQLPGIRAKFQIAAMDPDGDALSFRFGNKLEMGGITRSKTEASPSPRTLRSPARPGTLTTSPAKFSRTLASSTALTSATPLVNPSPSPALAQPTERRRQSLESKPPSSPLFQDSWSGTLGLLGTAAHAPVRTVLVAQSFEPVFTTWS